MNKAIFFHAGCPVCVSAEQQIVEALDKKRFEIVHLGEQPQRIDEAESAGVEFVPALLLAGQTYHINFGALLADVKGG